MATSTMESPDYRRQQQELPNKLFSNSTHSVSIDGPGCKLTSALQVVTEALSSTGNVSNPASSSIALPMERQSAHTSTTLNLNSKGFPSDGQNDNQSFQVQECPKTFLIKQATQSSPSTSFEQSNSDLAQGSSSSSNFSSLDSIRTTNAVDMVPPQGTISTATGKTIVSPDSDVSNGFVKDGKMLPYVFEANEAGKSTLEYT